MDFGSGLGFSDESARAAFNRQIDIFVDAALGNDSNDGALSSPLRTFQEAVYRADESNNAGFNNIFLAPGDYGGAVIDDYDLLKVFGTGVNPWDVSVTGDSQQGDTIHISGGTDVRLYNMHVTGSSYSGIYADGLDYLFMDRVVSDYHGDSGFYGEYVEKTKLYNSSFQHNNGFGAYMYDGYKVRTVNSEFSNNNNDGIRVDYAARMELIGTMAHNNGYNGDGFVASGGESDADGAEPNDVDSVLISGGSYNYNDRRGIDVDNVNDLTLLGVEASHNHSSGVEAEYVFGSALISGGLFEFNYRNGVNLNGALTTVSPAGTGGETEGATAMVFGGQYLNNGDDGLDVFGFYEASLFGVDARSNGDDGIDAAYIGHLLIGGGFLYDNYEHGLEVQSSYYTQVNDLVSKENGYDGLNLRGGHRLNVIGGDYSQNGEWGINAGGGNFGPVSALDGEVGLDELQRVDIKFATVKNNYGGVYVSYSYLGKMVGGTYSENYYDGIVFDNVAHGMFQDIVVLDNGDYGLRFDAGLFDHGDPGEPVLPGNSESYLHGSNWNRVDLLGGLYRNNGYDGIYISTDRNRGFNQNYIEVVAEQVVSRNNGYTGFNVGGNMYDIEIGDGGFGSDLYLDMVGGYFGDNGYDGIYLLGVINQQPDLGLLVAKMVDVVAEHNGGYGVIGSSALFGLPGDISDYAVSGHEGYYSLIQVTGGSYSFNGQNGVDFKVAVFDDSGFPDIPGINSGDGNEYDFSLASFDHMVAVNNGNNGLNFEGQFRVFDEFAGSSQSTINGGNPYDMALIEIRGGVYNQNTANGIRLISNVEYEESRNGNLNDIVAARMDSVEASLNGKYGLFIYNYGSEFFRGDVDILGGVYNSNDRDGVFVGGLGYLNVNQATIIGNHEDGLDSYNNLGTSISSDSVIVNNDVQNVRIS